MMRLPYFAMEKRDGGYHGTDIFIFIFWNYGYYGWRNFVVFGYFITSGDHLEDIPQD